MSNWKGYQSGDLRGQARALGIVAPKGSSKQRLWQLIRRAIKQCVRCGSATWCGGSLCQMHLKKQREYNRRKKKCGARSESGIGRKTLEEKAAEGTT